MCVDFEPATAEDLADDFQVESPSLEWRKEVWQDYAAPIIVGAEGSRHALVGSYGFIPKTHMPPGVRLTTMNARAETVGQLRSYKSAWVKSQLCLVPCRSFFEPNYESGKAVRWRINMADEQPFAVAGVWRTWDEGTNNESHSFTQLTINADDHPFMCRFHKPNDEKRSLVILPRDSWDDWLGCKDPEFARSFLTLYPAELMKGEPAPLPPRKKKSDSQNNLF